MEKSRIDLPIGVTLDRFIKNNQSQYPQAAGELSQLLRDIVEFMFGHGAKFIG